MSYDEPLTITYNIANQSLNTTFSKHVKGPPGAKGLIRAFSVINKGTNGTNGDSMTFALGTDTDADAYCEYATSDTIGAGHALNIPDSAFTDRIIDADTILAVALTNAANPTNLGAIFTVVVDWEVDMPSSSDEWAA